MKKIIYSFAVVGALLFVVSCQKEATELNPQQAVNANNVSHASSEGSAWFDPNTSTKSSFVGTDDGLGNINGTFMLYATRPIIKAKFIVTQLGKRAMLSSESKPQMTVNIDGLQPVVFGPAATDSVGEITFSQPLSSNLDPTGGTLLPVTIIFNPLKNFSDSAVTYRYTLLSFTVDDGTEYRDSVESVPYRLVGSYISATFTRGKGRLKSNVPDTLGVLNYKAHGGIGYVSGHSLDVMLNNVDSVYQQLEAVDARGKIIPCKFSVENVNTSGTITTSTLVIMYGDRFGLKVTTTRKIILISRLKLNPQSQVAGKLGNIEEFHWSDDRYITNIAGDNTKFLTFEDYEQVWVYPRFSK